MKAEMLKKWAPVPVAAALVWLGVRFVLPVALPFLLGGLLALASEPAAAFAQRRLRLSRPVASFGAVVLSLGALAGLLWLLGAVAVGQLGELARTLPDMQAGAAVLEDGLVALTARLPQKLRPAAAGAVEAVFDDGAAVLQQLAQALPGAVTGLVSRVGSSLVGIGTALLSAFLISARLPRLRQYLQTGLPRSWYDTWLPAARTARKNLLGWLKAQGTLLLIVWAVVTVGLLLLKIPHAPLWAALVASVDAVPMLGTGLVLGPWAAVSFLQAMPWRGAGLLAIYGVAALTRTALEPRLVGKQLGLDPLVSLAALYAGFRLWGLPGLILAPVLLAVGKSLKNTAGEKKNNA